MSATFRLSPDVASRPLYLAMVAGLACAVTIGKALPLGVVQPIGSYALPNMPGQRVTIMRVFYGPGARNAEPAELIAALVADEGALLTTLVE